MEQKQNGLKIHTSVRPAAEPIEKMISEEKQEKVKRIQRKPVLRITHNKQQGHRKTRARPEKQALTTGEKLLRNTALSCALLLSVLALKNVEQPWSQNATEGIRQVVNMRIDWDDTLGRLSFVRALVPDTALVFLNLGAGVDMKRPVDGQIVHEYTEQQPWLEYSCQSVQAVCAALDGTVTAAGQGAGEEWIVAIQSAGGTETVYGYLAEAKVQAGQSVEAGQVIGTTFQEAGRLYFELRENGNPADPSGRMK